MTGNDDLISSAALFFLNVSDKLGFLFKAIFCFLPWQPTIEAPFVFFNFYPSINKANLGKTICGDWDVSIIGKT